MPKQSPVPDEVDQGFWDACNEERLVIQHCTACDRLQQPPEAACYQCGSKDHLVWKAMSGRGTPMVPSFHPTVQTTPDGERVTAVSPELLPVLEGSSRNHRFPL